MRFFEISSGVRVPVSEEEQSILDKVLVDRNLIENSLNEREREIARLMVSRGLLNRRQEDDKIILQPNDMLDIWRI